MRVPNLGGPRASDFFGAGGVVAGVEKESQRNAATIAWRDRAPVGSTVAATMTHHDSAVAPGARL
jgi:hypothetical protein